MRTSLTDLSGLIAFIPQHALRPAFRAHSCDFCIFSKAQNGSGQLCRRNKSIVNYLAFKKRQSFSGHCPLGMFEIVQPLLMRNRIIGILYSGGVVLDRQKSRQRIRATCSRLALNSEPYLKALANVPLASEADISTHSKRLASLAALVVTLIESWGLPAKPYREGPVDFQNRGGPTQKLPFLVQRAMQIAQERFSEPLALKEIASELNCHPSTLSRTFHKSLGTSFGTYLQKMRIARAQNLIALQRFSITEIGFAIGFQDKSHFSRVFKHFTGRSPQQYALDMHQHDV